MHATVSRPEADISIDVRGGLNLLGPTGRPVRLRADGSTLILAAPGWAELRRLGPRALRSRRRALAAAAGSLRKLGLSLAVEIHGRPALCLGAGVRSSLLARLLGLQAIDMRLSNLVASLIR